MEDEKQSRTKAIVLGGSANAPCPKCGKRIAFFNGKEGDFVSETKTFAPDTVVTLKCPVDGTFNVRAGDFHDTIIRPSPDRQLNE